MYIDRVVVSVTFQSGKNNLSYHSSVFLNWGNFSHRDIWQSLERCFHNCEGAIGIQGQKPGLLLNILQCAEQLPTTKNCPTQMSVVPRLRNLEIVKIGNLI